MADRIRKINSQTSDVHAVITTSSLPAGAALDGMAVSAEGTVYATDMTNEVVYKIFEDGRVLGAVVGKIATTGDRASSGLLGSDGNYARLRDPYGCCVDASGNIFISDNYNNKVKRLSPSGRCQTLAGQVTSGDVCSDDGLACKFNGPAGVAVDKAGIVYVADQGNNKIKKIWPSGKTVSLAGATGAGAFANGSGANANFNSPTGIAVDNSGNVYVMDRANYRIRKVDTAGNATTIAGGLAGYVDGDGNAAKFGLNTWDICIDPANNYLYVIDQTNTAVRKISVSGKVTTFMHTSNTGTNSSIAMDKSGFLYVLEQNV